MIRNIAFFLLATFGLLFGPTGAGFANALREPWKSAREAGNRLTTLACKGDKRAVAEVWHRVRTADDPILQSNIGWLSENCASFDVPDAEQVKWLQRSVQQHYPVAMANYALRLLKGDGVPKDTAAGLALAEKAIDAGSSQAAINLAWHYAKGDVLPRDLEKARRYQAMAMINQAETSRIDQIDKAIAEARAAKRAHGPTAQQAPAARAKAPAAASPTPRWFQTNLVKPTVTRRMQDPAGVTGIYGLNADGSDRITALANTATRAFAFAYHRGKDRVTRTVDIGKAQAIEHLARIIHRQWSEGLAGVA